MTTATAVQLTSEEKQALILAGVGPISNQELVSLGEYPYFTHLTGAMLRRLVDASAVELGSKSSDSILCNFIFPIRDDEKALAFLEEFPKFVAGGFVRKGIIGIETIASETKVTAKEASAFKKLFGHAAIYFWISKSGVISKNGVHASNSFRRSAYKKLFAFTWFDGR